jgi:hypothetical protein
MSGRIIRSLGNIDKGGVDLGSGRENGFGGGEIGIGRCLELYSGIDG